jgi:hypothetical protein
MKIAISGTHSTGKTTFLKDLQKLIGTRRKIKVVRGVAHEAMELGFPILKNHTFQSTLWMMSAGMKAETELEFKKRIIFVDRPVMEPLAYYRAALKSRNEVIKPEHEKCLLGIARSFLGTYQMVIKTVVDRRVPISRNKKRDHDPAFRALADKEIDRLYKELGMKPTRLKRGDR